jgi:hypothetical protein
MLGATGIKPQRVVVEKVFVFPVRNFSGRNPLAHSPLPEGPETISFPRLSEV